MIRIAAFLLVAFLFVFLASPVLAANVSYCAQAHDSVETHLKWALGRQGNGETLQNDDRCRAYRSEFYEAAETRQNVTHCEQDAMRQSALEVIDAEINASNDLIARYCRQLSREIRGDETASKKAPNGSNKRPLDERTPARQPMPKSQLSIVECILANLTVSK